MCFLVIYKEFVLKGAHNLPHILLHLCLSEDATQCPVAFQACPTSVKTPSFRYNHHIIQNFASVCV